ncbi:MAG TPA: methyltransferase domain-containing protein [Thermomicrobiales bacterium]|nr:methyltransferase domain-containing protein [Thermomicrobiales bacterium]
MTDDRSGQGAPATWDATTYHRVSDPHARWGAPIVERLDLRGDETVIDAGCGTGRVSAQVLERLPRGRLIAVDRDAAMIQSARTTLGPVTNGRVRYVRADLLNLDAAVGEPADRVFSTATFHWIDDHARLFGALFRSLRPGGWLVAQCGGAGNIGRLREHVDKIAADPAFAPYLAGWPGPWTFSDADTVAQHLLAAGFDEIQTELIDAPVTHPDAETYAEFIRSVVLGEHLLRLPDDAARDCLVAELSARASGDTSPYTLDYVRLNIVARRPDTR